MKHVILLLPLLVLLAETASVAPPPLPPLKPFEPVRRPHTEYRAPYLPDYTHIDFRQCNDGDENSVCVINECKTSGFPLSTQLKPFFKADLSDKKNCHQGVYMKPIVGTHWFVMVQLFVEGLDPTEGITVKFGTHDLAQCTYNDKGAATFKSAFAHATVEGRTGVSFSSKDGMMCIFDIKSTESVSANLRTAGNRPWSLVVKTKKDGLTKTVSLDWVNLLDEMDKRSNQIMAATRIPDVAGVSPWRWQIDFTKPIVDFGSYACPHKSSRLVFDHANSVREVKSDAVVAGSAAGSSSYMIIYADDVDKSKPVPVPIEAGVLTAQDPPLSVACATKNCHAPCSPLPPVRNCDGCSRPFVVKPPFDYKECPAVSCRGGMWAFEVKTGATSVIIVAHDKDGPQCVRVNDKYGWYRPSTGEKVLRASCSPQMDCTVSSPFNVGDCKEKDCHPMIVHGRADCKKGRMMMIQQGIEWEEMFTALYCDFKTGVWYFGNESMQTLDHVNTPVKCEVLDDPYFAIDRDRMTRAGFYTILFGLLGTSAGLCLILGVYYLIMWQTEEFRYLMHLKVRPRTRAKTAFKNLCEVREMGKLKLPLFVQIIQEFQLYSIHERMVFVDYCINDMGMRIDIEQFIALFFHCIEMESDYRVWRLLAIGMKIVLIGLNQVNRSRHAMKLSEYVKEGTEVLLKRIGFHHTFGEDEGLYKVRDIALIFKLIFNDKNTMMQVLEENVMFRDEENISKRRTMMAYRMRAANLQDDRYNTWLPRDDEDMAHLDAKYEKALNEKYGTYREHFIYGVCTGKDPDLVEACLNRIIIDPAITNREIIAGFTASIEDSYDMRFAAKGAFIKSHESLKKRMPVGSKDYMKIFDMFARYASYEYGQDDNWLIKYVYSTPSPYTLEEKAGLPMQRVGVQRENGKMMLKKAISYSCPPRNPINEPRNTSKLYNKLAGDQFDIPEPSRDSRRRARIAQLEEEERKDDEERAAAIARLNNPTATPTATATATATDSRPRAPTSNSASKSSGPIVSPSSAASGRPGEGPAPTDPATVPPPATVAP